MSVGSANPFLEGRKVCLRWDTSCGRRSPQSRPFRDALQWRGAHGSGDCLSQRQTPGNNGVGRLSCRDGGSDQMECKTAESDLPLIQAERTEDGEEPPPLLHLNAAWGCAPSSRTQITTEIGPQSGTIQSYSYTEPRTAVLWDDRVPMGSAVLAIRWDTGRPPGVTQPERLATMTPVGGPFLLIVGRRSPTEPSAAVRRPGRTQVGGPFLPIVGRRSLTKPSAAVRRPGRTQVGGPFLLIVRRRSLTKPSAASGQEEARQAIHKTSQ